MVKIVTDPVDPEPDPINTDCSGEDKSAMRSDPPIVTYRFRTFLDVVPSSIPPQAENTEEIASTELHEDKAVNVS
jgi:hypothetical protein